MSIDLRYGRNASVRFDLPPQTPMAHCDAPRGKPISDVGGAVSAALAEPLGYPPLAKAVVPDDHVVIAVGAGLPHAQTVVDMAVRVLVDAGVEPADVTLLGQAEATVTTLGAQWPDARHLVHDPADRRQMAFLGRTGDQMQIVLNRALVDADVVISVGCLRPSQTLGYNGPAGGLSPAFADEPTQRRFRAFHCTPLPRQHAERRAKRPPRSPGCSGRGLPSKSCLAVARISCTCSPATWRRWPSAERSAAMRPGSSTILRPPTWSWSPSRAAEQQTWDNVCLALSAAADVTQPDGAIAICSELATPAGEALQMLAGADSLAEAEHAIRKSPPADALAALELARALADHHVYLLSRLPSRDVEELGMVAVSHPGELAHLARSRPLCLLLSGGQHVQTSRCLEKVTR